MPPKKITQNPNQNENINASSSSTSKQINWDVFFSEEENFLLNEYQKLLSEKEMIEWEIKNAEKDRGRKEKLTNYHQSLSAKINYVENSLGVEKSCESDSKKETEQKIPEGAASTSEGKEVIKAEITQELEKARNIFENFQINLIEYSAAKNEITEKLLELHERKGCEAEIDLMACPDLFFGSLFERKAETQILRRKKAQIVAETLGRVVMKMASNTITDLQAQKNKIVKKINKLIDARNAEVIQAQEIIKALETINQEAKNENKDLKEKSDREIRDLQRDIKKLNEQLKEINERENKLKEFRTRQLARELEENSKNSGKQVKNLTMSPEEEIKDLKKRLEETKFTALTFKEAEKQRALELQHEKEAHERTTTRLNADLEAKQDELERKSKIFSEQMKESEDKIKKLEKKISDLNTKIDEKDEELNEQQPTINELRGEKDRLTNLLDEAQNEKQELQAKYDALTEKSLFYKAMDALGIVSLKNSLSNVAVIAGLVVIIYGISWMYKNLIKTAYKNFKGEPKTEKDHEPTPPIPTNQNPSQQPPPSINYYQPPKYSPVLSIENQASPRIFHDSENTRELSYETPKNELRRDREKNSEINEKNHEPTPAKKKSKKRKKNKDTPH